MLGFNGRKRKKKRKNKTKKRQRVSASSASWKGAKARERRDGEAQWRSLWLQRWEGLQPSGRSAGAAVTFLGQLWELWMSIRCYPFHFVRKVTTPKTTTTKNADLRIKLCTGRTYHPNFAIRCSFLLSMWLIWSVTDWKNSTKWQQCLWCVIHNPVVPLESKPLSTIDHHRPYSQEATVAINAKLATITSKPHSKTACVHSLLEVDCQPPGPTLPAVSQLLKWILSLNCG